ncbi:MAG: response regulator [Nitrospirae bacterium]|nr:response regulator [Nitrospirota bacterium]
MTETILCVDDDPNILDAYQRQLRKQFRIETALGGERGLAAVAERGPFAVVVSDLRMPDMDGIRFLGKVRDLAPDTVRMMLTGNADVQAAIEAVNVGHIFRFLTKPCPPEFFAGALTAGLAQYRLVTAEKELLEQTLSGSIKVLSDVLALVNPEAFGRSARVTRYVGEIAVQMNVPDLWCVKTAAMLSQVGCIILPEPALTKLYRGQTLTAEESQLFNQHPFVASDLLGSIPRMEPVAKIIKYQEKRFDGSGVPRDACQGEAIPIGARILKVALDFDALEAADTPKDVAFERLKQRAGWYDPAVLQALKIAFAREIKHETLSVKVSEFAPGMILAQDVENQSGLLLLAKGQEVTQPLMMRLQNFSNAFGVQEPIAVLVPLIPAQEGSNRDAAPAKALAGSQT